MRQNGENFNPLISVVVPTLHRDAPLRTLLWYFLERESYRPFELIVIDQSERHDQETTDFLSSSANRMKYVRVDYKSLPMARNHGIRIASWSIVVFIDDDAEPAPGFLAAHVAPYASPQVMGVTGPILAPDQPLLSQGDIANRHYTALLSGAEMWFCVDFAFHASWAAGGNMSFRREIIERVGGFDENFYGVALGEMLNFLTGSRKPGG